MSCAVITIKSKLQNASHLQLQRTDGSLLRYVLRDSSDLKLNEICRFAQSQSFSEMNNITPLASLLLLLDSGMIENGI